MYALPVTFRDINKNLNKMKSHPSCYKLEIKKIFWKPIIGDGTLDPTVTSPCNEFTQNIVFIINSKRPGTICG